MFGQSRNADGHFDEASQVAIFRTYLAISAAIYIVGAILHLLVNFQTASMYVFIALTIFPLLLLALSYLGVPRGPLLWANMILIFLVNQVQFVLNPHAYHVLVYWVGLTPMIVTVLMQRVRDTVIWTILVIIFIFANGIYVSRTTGPYTITVYPDRFVAGGFLFALFNCAVAGFFTYYQIKGRKALIAQNEVLSSLKKELEQQRDELNLKNERLECYIKCIIDLSQSEEVIRGEHEQAVKRICYTLQQVMKIMQVSYWTYEEDKDTITKRYVYPEKAVIDTVHCLKDLPRYSVRLKSKKVLAAKNAITDPSTSEFGEEYLRRKQIIAMLDAPLVINGQLVGIICCEENKERNWNAEDMLVASAACDILTISFKAQQNKDYTREIEEKNDELSSQSEEITLINEKLRAVNEHLEERVQERTKELEEQNNQLSEYAFINSHLLRAPLSSILGLINLLSNSDLSKKEEELVKHLKESGVKLDEIIHRISDTIEKGNQPNREDLNNLKK